MSRRDTFLVNEHNMEPNTAEGMRALLLERVAAVMRPADAAALRLGAGLAVRCTVWFWVPLHGESRWRISVRVPGHKRRRWLGWEFRVWWVAGPRSWAP